MPGEISFVFPACDCIFGFFVLYWPGHPFFPFLTASVEKRLRMNKTVVRQAFIKSAPVMAGYIVLGIGFGILLRNAGYQVEAVK